MSRDADGLEGKRMRTHWNNSARSSSGTRPVRHGVAAAIFWVLPLLAFAGVVAPEFVEVGYEEEEEVTEARSGTVMFRPVRLGRPPLVVPRDYSAGFTPELLDLERLFNDPRFRGELGQLLSRLPSFPSSRGDSLVIDDVDTIVAQQLFKDLLDPTFVAESGDLWDPNVFDVIPPLYPIGNDSRFDDFPDPGVDPSEGAVVPEPHTGVLVGLGLLGLASLRRRR